MNQDLERERKNSKLRVQELNSFIGRNLFLSDERFIQVLELKKILASKIKSLYDENYENLERGQKYELVLKKSLELIEFANEHNVTNYMEYTYLIGEVMGTEKHLFGLHFTMFTISLELWSTREQKIYWDTFLKENNVFGTYIQTEIGHGTFIRGLETTATYDPNTQEFILDSPTLTSIKFWPGASGKTCNYAIVMAKLIINQKDYGIHAFVVQLRSLENHSPVPGIELGDIGKKHAYEAIDNGFIKFNNVRIPRNNMLMRFAQVLPNGEFKRLGNEIVMYACMLIMRGTLCMFASLLHSISTTIAIRYSCVRRQTADPTGLEPQIIDYQTQQYRLLPGLATTYANFFATIYFRNILNIFKKKSKNFSEIDTNQIAKLHALSSGIKAMVFDECLKFGQLNRLCCGGHGYSASSGLQPIIQEADAGCTYEGDNIVLYLQTARFLLKSVQKGFSPHIEFDGLEKIKMSSLFKRFEKYIFLFEDLYEKQLNEVSNRMLGLIEDQNMDRFDAWNNSSVLLVEAAKIYINLFIIYMFMNGIYEHQKSECLENQIILEDLFELYLTYAIVEKFSNHFLKLDLIDSSQMTKHQSRLFELLKNIRLNAVGLVDAFGWSDSNLSSSLGVYDGNVYEKFFQFAKSSLFSQNFGIQTFDRLARPYILTKSKL